MVMHLIIEFLLLVGIWVGVFVAICTLKAAFAMKNQAIIEIGNATEMYLKASAERQEHDIQFIQQIEKHREEQNQWYKQWETAMHEFMKKQKAGR